MPHMNSKNKDRIAHSIKAQPPASWLSFDLQNQHLTPDPRAHTTLSPHVLNLRPGLVPQAPHPTENPQPIRRTGTLPSQNFLSHFKPSYTLSFSPQGKFLHRYPIVRMLSAFTVVEVVWLPAAFIWNVVAYAYLRLADEMLAVAREVKADAAGFVEAVALVFQTPFRLLAPQRVEVQVRVRRELRWPVMSQVAFFFVVGLIITIPLKGISTWAQVSAREGTVVELAAQAVGNLRAGSSQLQSGNPALAELDFKHASETFNQAIALLGGLPDQMLGVLDKLPGTPQKLVAASHLLEASKSIAQAATIATRTWTQVSDAQTSNPTDIGSKVSLLQLGLSQLKPELDNALSNLKAVDPGSLPPNLGGAVAALQAQLGQLESLVVQAFTLPSFLQQVLVSATPKRYVVMFQNSSELRPTGGFMGSLALIELTNGKVSQAQIPGGGPYDFQGSLKQVIKPPEPLRLVRGTWQLQDANWFFDFPTSAKKVLWFLKASGGPEAQGVVALTPDIVLKLLKLTGPLEMPKYHKTLTADNFMRETQLAVEVEYDKQANRPKQFIADVTEVLMQRVLNLKPEERIGLVTLMAEGITQHSLQVYLTDPELQANVESYGWSGEVRQVPLDYLAIVRTNIGGGKTDAVTDEVVRQEVEVQSSGDVISRLEFTRTHHGSAADLFEQRRNTDYVRFYVPEGATLLSADGFSPPKVGYFKASPAGAQLDQDLVSVEQNPTEDQATSLRITTEFGKTVFAGWLGVAPGESQTVRISYKLPFTLRSESSLQDLRRYSIYFQRQAGVRPMNFTSTLKLPEGWRVRWQESSTTLTPTTNGLEFKSDWTKDEYYGSVLERLAQ